MEVRGLNKAICNLKNQNIPLAAEYGNAFDNVVINGLIGADLLQYINFKTSKCMNGSALEVETGFIPFGNAEHFLYPNELSKFESSRIENNFNTIVAPVKCPISLVNACLEPKAIFPDDLAPLFDESSVERRIDRMLTCDSLGMENVSNDISNYDRDRIAQFEAGILIKDQVFVELVWNDSIQDVP